jgi:hypothetical protein
MDKDRLDLGAIDPTRDRARFDRLVATTMWRARRGLQRRAAAAAGPTGMLEQWFRPMLAAAAITAVIAGSVLSGATSYSFEDVTALVAGEQMTFSALRGDWAVEARTPDLADLVIALEGDLP